MREIVVFKRIHPAHEEWTLYLVKLKNSKRSYRFSYNGERFSNGTDYDTAANKFGSDMSEIEALITKLHEETQ